MTDPTTIRCTLCGDEALAVPVAEIAMSVHGNYPIDAGDVVPNARDFRVGEFALLHHECRSPQSGTDVSEWISKNAWWACQDLARPLDADAHFDLNCSGCAKRWAFESSRDD